MLYKHDVNDRAIEDLAAYLVNAKCAIAGAKRKRQGDSTSEGRKKLETLAAAARADDKEVEDDTARKANASAADSMDENPQEGEVDAAPAAKDSAADGKENDAQGDEDDTAPDDEDATQDDENPMVFPPDNGCKFYLGGFGEELYVRPCVAEVFSFVWTELEKTWKLNRERPNEHGPGLFIISGAAGIGKSWSINAVMASLLQQDKKVFFHSGAQGRAWMIEKDGEQETGVLVRRADPINIMELGNEWIYVYDSPGSKSAAKVNAEAVLRLGKGEVTLIVSSPKAANYGVAESKRKGWMVFLHIPTWKRVEMVFVKKGKVDKDIVNASYEIWGGNMRALEAFFETWYRFGKDKAIETAENGLSSQIDMIDKKFARKMVRKLEKQEVQGQFTGEAVKDSSGHILTPEPKIRDGNDANCCQDFQWRFCSPLAEKKFWKHVEDLDHELLKELMIEVFKTPSPKGVLFEKVAHLLITNAVVKQFRCYPYKKRSEETVIKFEKCSKVVGFQSPELKKKLCEAVKELGDNGGCIGLEPTDASFDAVDMFVLEKTGKTGTPRDWCLYMIQDTISKGHSFHPVKVLWYCSLFCDVLQELFPIQDASYLKCCKYVPVVPHQTTEFKLAAPTGTATWPEVNRVASLLKYQWPRKLLDGKLDELVAKEGLIIPKTAKGEDRKKLTKPVVGHELLLASAKGAVEDECLVIFDVVRSYQKLGS